MDTANNPLLIHEPGATPQEVLDHIRALEPAALAGKTVFVFSGLQNAPAQQGVVAEQLAALKAAGVVSIAVYGFNSTVDGWASLNSLLQKITSKAEVAFFEPTEDLKVAIEAARRDCLNGAFEVDTGIIQVIGLLVRSLLDKGLLEREGLQRDLGNQVREAGDDDRATAPRYLLAVLANDNQRQAEILAHLVTPENPDQVH